MGRRGGGKEAAPDFRGWWSLPPEVYDYKLSRLSIPLDQSTTVSCNSPHEGRLNLAIRSFHVDSCSNLNCPSPFWSIATAGVHHAPGHS
jgi:hypothetical protein